MSDRQIVLITRRTTGEHWTISKDRLVAVLDTMRRLYPGEVIDAWMP